MLAKQAASDASMVKTEEARATEQTRRNMAFLTPAIRDLEYVLNGRSQMKTEKYFYRSNPDTTIDAICPFCFMTAATATNEADLLYLESLHRCPTEPFVAEQHLRLAS